MNCKEPPFDDVKVRQAVMIGLDLKAFARLEHAEEISKHWCPFDPGNPEVYTPLEELPADIQLLYKYDPTLARQMLDAAGIPVGFKTSIYAEPTAVNQAAAALVKDQWAKIGIDVEIVTKDLAALTQLKYTVAYKGAIYMPVEVANPITSLTAQGKTGGYINFSGWSNSSFDELMDRLVLEQDVDEQSRLCKEAALIWLNEVPYVPLNPIVNAGYWWPWLKNFHGEYSLADQGTASIMPYIWLDQDQKGGGRSSPPPPKWVESYAKLCNQKIFDIDTHLVPSDFSGFLLGIPHSRRYSRRDTGKSFRCRTRQSCH